VAVVPVEQAAETLSSIAPLWHGPAHDGTRRPGTRKAKRPPYERPRGGPAKPVAELVPQIGRAAFRRFGFVQSSVVTRWPEIVGDATPRVHARGDPLSRRARRAAASCNWWCCRRTRR
jgi:hypothetical protein